MRADRPSTSAQTVAMCRSVLNAKHVIDDPIADSLLHRPHRVLARWLQLPLLSRLASSPTFTFLAARTLFFDAQTTAALDHDVGQVVIVGAGYDSRAWRLARAGATFYEVDHPATQADKQRLAATPGPVCVAADLMCERVRALLPAAGFQSERPAVFIVEGLTMYLPEETVCALLSDLAEIAAPGSHLAVNFTVQGGGSASGSSRAIAWVTRRTWHWRGEPTYGWVNPDTISDLLNAAGWTVSETLPAPELASRYLHDTDLRTDGLNPDAICVAAILH